MSHQQNLYCVSVKGRGDMINGPVSHKQVQQTKHIIQSDSHLSNRQVEERRLLMPLLHKGIHEALRKSFVFSSYGRFFLFHSPFTSFASCHCWCLFLFRSSIGVGACSSVLVVVVVGGCWSFVFFTSSVLLLVRWIMVRTRGLGWALGRAIGKRRPIASTRRQRQQERVVEDPPTIAKELNEEQPEAPIEEVVTDVEGFLGGPHDTSVLIDFENHIALRVWNREESPELKLSSHGRKMTKFGRPALEIEGLVAASGLSPLIACSLDTGDRRLINFHLPVGEVTITLDDIVSLLHLPVVGAFHSFELLHVDDAVEMLVELLEVSVAEARAKMIQCHGSYVRLSWLCDVYELKIEACHWIVAARVYLLHLLRCTLFSNKSATDMHVARAQHIVSLLSKTLNASLALSENLLTRVKRKNCAKRNVKVSEPFLKPGIAERKERALNSCERTLNSRKSLKSEINRGKEQSKKPSFDLLGRLSGCYAWGTAAFVHMYDNLNDASKSMARKLAGYITLLQCWIYEHFPSVGFVVPAEDYDERRPCACRWTSGKALLVSMYRRCLDRLTPDVVCWIPYGDHRSFKEFEVISLFSSHLIWGLLTIIHRLERVTIPPHPAVSSLSVEEIDDRWMQFDMYQQPMAAATPNKANVDVHHVQHAVDGFVAIECVGITRSYIGQPTVGHRSRHRRRTDGH
ncbi:Protein MAIN-LIKE 2 [Glycine max]|nr:Protein MAIN-LIKE 2 [Glycine max]